MLPLGPESLHARPEQRPIGPRTCLWLRGTRMLICPGRPWNRRRLLRRLFLSRELPPTLQGCSEVGSNPALPGSPHLFTSALSPLNSPATSPLSADTQGRLPCPILAAHDPVPAMPLSLPSPSPTALAGGCAPPAQPLLQPGRYRRVCPCENTG